MAVKKRKTTNEEPLSKTRKPDAQTGSISQELGKTQTTGFISGLDCYLFGAGTHYDIYQKLGAHPKTY